MEADFRVIRLGFSTFITQVAIVVVAILCNVQLAKYGMLSKYGADIPIAVFSIESKIFTVVINLVVGIALGCQPIVSYNVGARKHERVKELYMEKGYSVYAYTDHHVMIPHHELTDDRFLALTGTELTVHAPDELYKTIGKVCHFNIIALDPDHVTQEVYYPNSYEEKNADKLNYNTAFPPAKLE